MLSNFEQVRKFHEKFGLLSNSSPTNISKEEWKLRWELISEEYTEVWEELFEQHDPKCKVELRTDIDLKKVAKELGDLLYVVYGTYVALGINADVVFEEIQRSNMSKLDKDGNVLRRDDGKILKSDQYSPANMDKVFNDLDNNPVIFFGS